MSSTQSCNAAGDNADLSVVVVGGCHTVGWQIGESPPFWSDAARAWSGSENVSCYGPISLKKSVDILQSPDLIGEGTLLIIQLGNFEASELSVRKFKISNIVDKFKKYASLGAVVKSEDIECDSILVLSFKNEIKLRIKGGVLLLVEFLLSNRGLSAKIRDSLRDRVDKIFNIIDNWRPKSVVVLSTFPTASPVINYYRKKMNYLLREMS